MNNAIFDYFGTNETWCTVTDLLLFSMIGIFAIFAFMGLIQWIKRKNIFKVDKELLLMIPHLVAMVLIYVFFEKVWVVSYRPILIDGALEPSFPSMHTMTSVTLALLMMCALSKYVKKKSLRVAISIFLGLLALTISFGRILAGVHWFSDICGGIIFGMILALSYATILKLLREKEKNE